MKTWQRVKVWVIKSTQRQRRNIFIETAAIRMPKPSNYSNKSNIQRNNPIGHEKRMKFSKGFFCHSNDMMNRPISDKNGRHNWPVINEKKHLCCCCWCCWCWVIEADEYVAKHAVGSRPALVAGAWILPSFPLWWSSSQTRSLHIF